MSLGAKSSVGFGKVATMLSGSVKTVVTPEYSMSMDVTKSVELKYIEHLRANKDRIMSLLEEIA
jgi:hypothetical protein